MSPRLRQLGLLRPLVSAGLLLLAYATVGWFLQHQGVAPAVWLGVAGFAIAKASILTILWKPVRRLLLLGFQSDLGYFVLVLSLASMAVLSLMWIQLFAYGLVVVGAALLVRVDTLIANWDSIWAWGLLWGLPLTGLGLSWGITQHLGWI